MKRYLFLTVLITLLFSVELFGHAWPMFQQNPARTGRANGSTIVVDTLFWSVNLGVNISSFTSLLVAEFTEGVRIVVPTDNGIYFLDISGNITGFIQTDFPVETTPALHEARIYFASGDSLYCYLSDGTKLWSVCIGQDGSHICVYNDFIYINADDRLWKFSINGDSLWATDQLGGGIRHSAPAIDESGNIYVATIGRTISWYDFKIYSFNPNGSERWSYSSLPFEPGGIQMTPTIDLSQNIYFATKYSWGWNSSTYCVQNGAKNWDEWSEVVSLAYSDSRIFSTGNDRVEARDASTGDLVWHYNLYDNITYSSPIISSDGQYVYFGTDGGRFLVLDINTGNLAYEFDTQEGVLGSPAIDEYGRVYVSSQTGKIFCFGASTSSVEEPVALINQGGGKVNISYFNRIINIIGSDRMMLKIFDINGRMLISKGFEDYLNFQVNFPTGTYFIVVQGENWKEEQKIIVLD